MLFIFVCLFGRWDEWKGRDVRQWDVVSSVSELHSYKHVWQQKTAHLQVQCGPQAVSCDNFRKPILERF